LLEGALTVSYPDARAEVILFSPQHEHGQVIEHILAKTRG
jgi:hypothetical protein